MSTYGAYVGKRLAQFVLVIFIGINIAFFVTHMTPIDPVEQTISAATSFGSTSPEAIDMLRQSLRELYGLEGTPVGAVPASSGSACWSADFGPSLSAFPTPVSTLICERPALDDRRCSWSATLIAWVLGNLLGRPCRLLSRQPAAARGRRDRDGPSTRSPTTSSPSSC